jgi:hypothetical protein
MFRRIEFPTDDFFPPNVGDSCPSDAEKEKDTDTETAAD